MATGSLVLMALPVFAATSSTTPSTGGQSNVVCVQTAVDAREQAIGSAFTTFSTSESAALSARAAALHAAWGLGDQTSRRTARLAAWSAFKTANQSVFSALRSAKKGAWSTFTTATKSCHTPVVESAAGEGVGSLGL